MVFWSLNARLEGALWRDCCRGVRQCCIRRRAGAGVTYLLVGFLVVSSLSLEFAFYIERRDNASSARAMHSDDWFVRDR